MKVATLGAGQLARMLAQAGQSLNIQFMFLSPDKNSCAAPFGQHICANFSDSDGQQQLINWADILTYETENLPVDMVKSFEKKIPLSPSSSVLSIANDRLNEKNFFRDLNIPTAEFAAINNHQDLLDATQKISLPAILKTRTEGYDGKGQIVLHDDKDVASAWENIGKVPCILESMVAFQEKFQLLQHATKKEKLFFIQ